MHIHMRAKLVIIIPMFMQVRSVVAGMIIFSAKVKLTEHKGVSSSSSKDVAGNLS